MQDDSGELIIKPALPKEISFYETAHHHPEFAEWIPTFMGTLQPSEGDDDPQAALLAQAQAQATAKASSRPKTPLETSVVLSNVTYGFIKPCVVDVKLGAQLWDNDATPEKRARLDKVAQETTSVSLGFRIAGMKVWKGTEYQVYDKWYGRAFNTGNVITGFQDYYAGVIKEEHAKIVMERQLEKVLQIQAVLEGQESRMISSSLLFVYEGDSEALEKALEAERLAALKQPRDDEHEDEDEDDDEEEEEEEEDVLQVEDVKIIDFAHATWTPGEGPDQNALQGVYSIVSLLKKMCGD